MKKRDKMAILIFVVFYVLFGITITIFQERIIYYPSSQDFNNCPKLQNSKKVEHNGTRMYLSEQEGPVVVLYHGNAGSACDRSFYTDIFSSAGYGYMLVEYAGYSNDSRKPSHELVKQDVRNVISYLHENSISEVLVVGESIGTGAAAYHTSIQPPEKLLLISPFTDLKAVARNRFWFYPTKLLVDNAFDDVSLLKNYTGMVTIIHGTKDSIVPYKLGRELYESLATNKKNLITIEGAGHNDMFTFPETYTAVMEFLESSNR